MATGIVKLNFKKCICKDACSWPIICDLSFKRLVAINTEKNLKDWLQFKNIYIQKEMLV